MHLVGVEGMGHGEAAPGKAIGPSHDDDGDMRVPLADPAAPLERQRGDRGVTMAQGLPPQQLVCQPGN